jgi:hypothetical protein
MRRRAGLVDANKPLPGDWRGPSLSALQAGGPGGATGLRSLPGVAALGACRVSSRGFPDSGVGDTNGCKCPGGGADRMMGSQ